jgi:hypothetical protein
MAMTHPAKLLLLGSMFAVACLCVAPRARAQSDLSLVSRVPADVIDAEQLRAALEAELQVPTVLRDAPTGPTVQVEAETLHAVRVSFIRAEKAPVERTVDVSAQAEHASGIIVLLASNLVRDEAGELLAQLSAARPKPAAPSPPPPPAKPVRQFVNNACADNKLTKVPFGADFVPFVGMSMRHGTRAERGFSLNLLGGITGAVRGVELAGVFNLDRYSMCGVQLAGTFNFVGGDVSGVQLSGVNIATGSLRGAQLSEANIVGSDLSGAQLGMLNWAGGFVDGAQLGLANIAGDGLDGAQLGLANLSADAVSGAQLGLVNISADAVSGAQLGLVNIASKRVDGAMIGLVNVAEDADAAVGLVNVIWNGRAQIDVWATDAGLIMAGTTQGGRVTHNIYGIGIRPMADSPAFAMTLGIGARLYNTSWLTVDLDALSYGIVHTDPNGGAAEWVNLQQLRVPVSFAPLRGVWLFVAPSVSVSVIDKDSHMQKLALIGSKRVTSDDSDTNVRIWGGLSLGLRFF